MEIHPQLAILDEFKVAIDKMPMTIPEVKAEAEKLYAALSADPKATEDQVHDALVKIGKQVYPHRQAIEDLQAKHKIEDVADLVAGNMDEYQGLVKQWIEKQQQIEGKISELRSLSEQKVEFKDEILDEVKVLEEGWSVVERDPNLDKIKQKIEYWKGKLGMEN